jgi:hypothetical protein
MGHNRKPLGFMSEQMINMIIPFWSEKSPAAISSTNTVLLIHAFAVFKIMLKCGELHWPGTGVRCNKSSALSNSSINFI